MKIIKATSSHIPSVARLYVDSWRITYKGLVPDAYLNSLSYKQSAEKWSFFLIEPSHFILLAIDEREKIVGFSAGKPHLSGAEIYALYVCKEVQNQGVGHLLFFHSVKEFTDQHYTSMIIWAMKKNKKAVQFYKKLGGKKILNRTSQFGETKVEDEAYGWERLPSNK
ncbi:GNAT family N-acetyltransferase [Priestia megaterium]|uniref:GNAT family N-acetyltransferase n=1 Tax=Priestia megaterium TaxID=1404 RepID=UPI0025AF57DA|nr:GNAT family N-acetyltransferase [Priestia megaterium]MDN3362790.1 GNAT family N-acetyltransferase [Priestia megaterium]